MLRRVVIFLFFISGFTGLVYEIIWTRIFGLIFGNTTLAISTVLAAFMLGLALGSMFIGRFADHSKAHLRLYAFLEIGVGLTALLIPATRGLIEVFSAWIYPTLINQHFLFYIIKFVIAFIIMLPATFFMGGTLPVISRFFIKQKEKIGSGIGLLYAVNTFGAVIGVLFSAFYLIRIIGVNQTIYLAIFLNLAIGLIAYLFSVFYQEQEQPAENRQTDWQLLKDPQINMVLIIMAISGFVALSYEVVWSRVLVFVLTNSVYAFAVMLTTFLMGITIGSAIGAKFIDRIQNKLHLLGWIEIFIGLTALVSAYFLANFTQIHNLVFQAESQTNWFHWNFVRFLESFIIMFPPTFLMGVAFPLASRLCIPAVSKTGTGVGFVYFFNTVGGVLGSFLTGFLFISFLGASITVAIMIFISISIGIYILLSIRYQTKKMLNYSFLSFFILTVFLIFTYTPRTLFVNTYSTTEKDYPLIDFLEGIEGTVTVHESKMPLQQNKRIDVDGLNVAGTSFMLRTLQLLQGHLPNLIHRDATKVAQIGFGTGQTSAAALLYPIKNFTPVEISKDVMELSAKYFQDINQGVLKNPRFQYLILDGKNFVKYTSDRYDVIMNDANYAVATPSASLFTLDHFKYASKKLKPQGIFSTWMTTDLDPEDFKIVLKTFQSVFPHCMLWMAPNCVNKQVVLLGSQDSLKLDFMGMQEQFSNPPIKESLKAVNINSVYDLLSCLVLDENGIADISNNADVNSDNHPILEFSTKAIRARDLCAYQNLSSILMRRPDINSFVENLPEDQQEKREVVEKIKRYIAASRQLLKGMLEFYQGNSQQSMATLLDASRIIPESNLGAQFFKSMDVLTGQLSLEAQQNPEDIGARLGLIRHQMAQGNYGHALISLRKLLQKEPKNSILYYETARCFLAQSKSDSAEIYLRKSLELNPDLSGSWYFLGRIFASNDNSAQALEAFNRSIKIDPRIYESWNAIGQIKMVQENYEEAIKVFKTSIQLAEFQPDISLNLAKCYLKRGDYKNAHIFFDKTLKMGYHVPEVYYQMGNIAFKLRDYTQASLFFQKATELDSKNQDYYYNYGNSLAVQKEYQKAIIAYEKAIELGQGHPDYYNNLALCYRELGDVKKAKDTFNIGLKRYPNSELLRKNAEQTRQIVNK